jgi:cellulose synthase/poly-beta-1,6-N-acetylglucosamine synthase-like glycosyltransferase
MRLGDILVAQGALDAAQLNQALKQLRGRIGDYLRIHGFISAPSLARAVATQQQLPHVNLRISKPEAHLFAPREMPLYIAHQFIPYLHRGGVLTLATPEPSEDLRIFAQAHYRMPVAFVVVTKRDLTHMFATRGATHCTRTAKLTLRRLYPSLTADRIMHTQQILGAVTLVGLLAFAAYVAPSGTWRALLIVCNFFYAATLIVKVAFYEQGVAALKHARIKEVSLRAQVNGMADDAFPIYSILVPIYRESADVLARLIANLSALDYPHEKLDIKLICEADDAETLAALQTLQPPAMMEIIRVPASSPRTKPKACNVALQQVRGKFVVIYDAEDAPARDQLKRAVAMFRSGGRRLACLQAALNYYNRRENLLTRLFSIEYSALFRLLLPGLERMGIPIPLGGTSNHLRTEALRQVGGWDAFNVTEDADLGIRLHYFGYKTRTLPSLTLEESPITLGAWIKQRTRWIKGYIQTWLVYTRNPRALKRRIGARAYYGFQFFIGAPALTFLLAPFFWGICIASLMGIVSIQLSPAMVALCAYSFIAGMLSHWLFARKVLKIEGWQGMGDAFWLYPFYWLLHSLAAARALWQLVIAPHYWDKTKHGVSRLLA